MPRPCKERNIEHFWDFTCFKPAWVPRECLEKNTLEADELEALRLANLEELSHKEASLRMAISPATFNRLLKSALKKISDSLINGKAIRIIGKNNKSLCE